MALASSIKAFRVSLLFEETGINRTSDLEVLASSRKQAAEKALLLFPQKNPTAEKISVCRIVAVNAADESANLIHNSAEFSKDLVYRYVLKRVWGSGQLVQFIGLNPSGADLRVNDPTVRRCIGFAKSWGFGGLIMTNAFAIRATDPALLRTSVDPVGPDNDYWLKFSATEASVVVAAWGNHGEFKGRSQAIRNLGLPLCHLGLTASGMPKHPLYLKAALKPEPWL